MTKDRIDSILAGVIVFAAIALPTSLSFQVDLDYFKLEYRPPSEKDLEATQRVIALLFGTVPVLVAEIKKSSNSSKE
jgi:hypothetical protein